MLTAARELQVEQALLASAAATRSAVAAKRGPRFALAMVNQYQLESVNASIDALAAILLEQDLRPAAIGDVIPESLLTRGPGAVQLLASPETESEFDRLVRTLVADAGRTAMSVAAATEPAVSGYIRQVSPPCCGRCAVLAGRFYRWSTGFRRHPQCDCAMVPSNQANAKELTQNPDALFRAGQIRGLSRADMKAVNLGADLGQVVNVRSKRAGLKVGTSVMERGGRPTPAGILRAAGNDKARAIELLSVHAYIT